MLVQSCDSEAIDKTPLAASFTGNNVQALVRSACQSGRTESTELSNNLMFTISAKGCHTVITMRESIVDREVGVQFARPFFLALLNKQGAFPVTLQQARDAIQRLLEQDEQWKDNLMAGESPPVS
jgi:hypothetical protein